MHAIGEGRNQIKTHSEQVCRVGNVCHVVINSRMLLNLCACEGIDFVAILNHYFSFTDYFIRLV